MKRNNWIVDDYSIRPITRLQGKDECTYCGVPRGGEHLPDCVIRERTVFITATFEYVVTIPEHWTAEDFVFHRHEGSWCASNAISELENVNNCLCGHSEFSIVREATDEDEKEFGIYISKSSS